MYDKLKTFHTSTAKIDINCTTPTHTEHLAYLHLYITMALRHLGKTLTKNVMFATCTTITV